VNGTNRNLLACIEPTSQQHEQLLQLQLLCLAIQQRADTSPRTAAPTTNMAPVNLLPVQLLHVVSPGIETTTAAEADDPWNDDVEESLKSIAETLMRSLVLPGPKTRILLPLLRHRNNHSPPLGESAAEVPHFTLQNGPEESSTEKKRKRSRWGPALDRTSKHPETLRSTTFVSTSRKITT
jgi:hypothetical protein